MLRFTAEEARKHITLNIGNDFIATAINEAIEGDLFEVTIEDPGATDEQLRRLYKAGYVVDYTPGIDEWERKGSRAEFPSDYETLIVRW